MSDVIETVQKPRLEELLKECFSNRHQDVLSALHLLSSEGVKPVLFNLPVRYKLESRPNDIDLLLNDEGFSDACRILKSDGYVALHARPGPRQAVYVKYIPQKGFVRLHLHRHLHFFGLNLVEYERALEHTIECDGFSVASADLDEVILTVEWFFRRKAHYRSRIEQVRRHPDRCFTARSVEEICGAQAGLMSQLVRLCDKGVEVTTALQISLILSHRPWRKGPYLYLLWKLRERLRPVPPGQRKGLVVFFMGIDGAGKTTISDEAARRIEHGGFFCRRLYMGLKETVVQRIRRRVLKQDDRERFDGKSGVSDRLAKKSKIVAQLFNLVLAAAYVLEYACRMQIVLQFVRAGNNVLFVDRAYYDKLCDLHKWGNGMFYSLLPRPDLVFGLHGNTTELSSRKQEYQAAVLDEMQEAMERAWCFLEKRDVGVVRIDTVHNDIERSVEAVERRVWEKMVSERD